jgi:hypothetical protein
MGLEHEVADPVGAVALSNSRGRRSFSLVTQTLLVDQEEPRYCHQHDRAEHQRRASLHEPPGNVARELGPQRDGSPIAQTPEIFGEQLEIGMARSRFAFAGIRLVAVAFDNTAGNAKVEKLHAWSLRSVGKQHLVGLDIAMDDQLSMGMRHRCTQVEEMPERGFPGQALAGDEQGFTLQTFHYKPGFTLLGSAAIKDLADARMAQAREHTPLGLKKGRSAGSPAAITTRDLQGNFVRRLAVAAPCICAWIQLRRKRSSRTTVAGEISSATATSSWVSPPK